MQKPTDCFQPPAVNTMFLDPLQPHGTLLSWPSLEIYSAICCKYNISYLNECKKPFACYLGNGSPPPPHPTLLLPSTLFSHMI